MPLFDDSTAPLRRELGLEPSKEPTMRLALCIFLVAAPAFAHPASSIVVDDAGNVYFVDSSKGIGRFTDGILSYPHRNNGGHWMCLDEDGTFAKTQPRFFERVSPAGQKPALIFAEGGAPILVTGGKLLYGSNPPDAEPGGLDVTQMTPDGRLSQFSAALQTQMAAVDDGVTGLALGPDESIYVTCSRGLFQVSRQGELVMSMHPLELEQQGDPQLRGMAVDHDGTIYVAATGHGTLIRIRGKKPEVVLRSERPWSPTGVAVHGKDIFVLEYTNAMGARIEGWRPRVRRMSGDTITTLGP